MEGLELHKKYPILMDPNSWRKRDPSSCPPPAQQNQENPSNIVTIQYLFTPDFMKNKDTESVIHLHDDQARVILKSNDINDTEVILKGTVTTSTTNDYVLIYSKETETFQLQDVGMSVNGLKRDRQDDFSDVKNQIESSSEIKAKMTKRLKSSIPKPTKNKLIKLGTDLNNETTSQTPNTQNEGESEVGK